MTAGVTKLSLKLFTSIVLAIITTSAIAHVSEGTNTNIRISKTKLSLIYTLPTDNIKELKFGEATTIDNVITDGFIIKNNQQKCPVKLLGKKELTSVESTQFILNVTCDKAIQTLDIEYRLFVDEFAEHKNKTKISIGSRSQNFVFSPDKTNHEIKLGELIRKWSSKPSQK